MDYNLLVNLNSGGVVVAAMQIDSINDPIVIKFHFQIDLRANWDIDVITLTFDGHNFTVATGRGNDLPVNNPISKQLIAFAFQTVLDLEIRGLTGTEIAKINIAALEGFNKGIWEEFEGDEYNYPLNYEGKDYSVLLVKNGENDNSKEGVWITSTIKRTIVMPKEYYNL
jgi:hypothetical protein